MKKFTALLILLVFTTGCTAREVGLSAVGAATLLASAFVIHDIVTKDDDKQAKQDSKPKQTQNADSQSAKKNENNQSVSSKSKSVNGKNKNEKTLNAKSTNDKAKTDTSISDSSYKSLKPL